MTDFSGEFRAFDDAADLARQLSLHVRDLLGQAIRKRGRAALAVSGGTTPLPFFEALSQADLAWDKVVVTLADERWVDPADADSNEGLVLRHLLKNRASAATFLGMKTAAPSAAEGEDACNLRIRRMDFPLDVLILGMGGDGHTASLFPGAANLRAALDPSCDRICLAVSPPAASHDRMTLTLAAILNSRRIFVHITGAAKRAVYEKALSGDSVEEMPIRAVLGQKKVPVSVWWAP